MLILHQRYSHSSCTHYQLSIYGCTWRTTKKRNKWYHSRHVTHSNETGLKQFHEAATSNSNVSHPKICNISLLCWDFWWNCKRPHIWNIIFQWIYLFLNLRASANHYSQSIFTLWYIFSDFLGNKKLSNFVSKEWRVVVHVELPIL